MNLILDRRCEQEEILIIDLRDKIRSIIVLDRLDKEYLAEKLHLLPSGVDTIFAQQWSLEMTIRIAYALGIEFDCKFYTKKRCVL